MRHTIRNVPEFLGIFFKNYKEMWVDKVSVCFTWFDCAFCLLSFSRICFSSNSASLDVNCEASQPAKATLYLMRAPQLQLQRQEFLVHSQRMAFTVLLLRLLSNLLLTWHSLQWEKRNGAMGILSLMHNKSWLALVVFQGRSRSQIADCGLFWRQAGGLLSSEILLVWKQ